MDFNSEKHHRRSIRLKNYDYSQEGAYFITICTQNRECLFGEIVDGKMVMNEFGEIANRIWMEIPKYFTNVILDEWVIMPNHIHCIIVITETDKKTVVAIPVGAIHVVGAIHELPLHELPLPPKQRRKMIIPKIVGRFKMNVGKQINEKRETTGNRVWQRNYYEHIVRDESELNRIRKYIRENPINWKNDDNHTGNS